MLRIVLVGAEGTHGRIRSINQSIDPQRVLSGRPIRPSGLTPTKQTRTATGALGTGPGKSTLVERFLTGKYTAPLPPTTTASVRARAPYALNKHTTPQRG